MGAVAIVMGTLVVASQLAEVRCRPGGGHSPFSKPGDGGGVVAEGLNSGVGYRLSACQDIKLRENGGLFQVAVGDMASGVFCGDQGSLDVHRKGVTPVVALAMVVEEETTHAGPGCVRGTQEGWGLWDQLGEVSGPRTKAGR